MKSESPSAMAVAPFGHFDDDKREFVLTTWHPPKPWRNILFNRTFNIQPVQSGAGIAYRHDEDGTNILVNWSGEQAIYIVDLDSGEYFSMGGPTGRQGKPDAFESRYGQGYQVVRQENLKLAATLTMTVPTEGDVVLLRLRVEDLSGKARRLRLVAFSDIDLNVKDPYHGTRNRFFCTVSGNRHVLDTRNNSYLANRLWQAYLGSSRPLECYAFEREELIGVYGTTGYPEHLLENWAGHLESPMHPALVGAVKLSLEAGKSGEWYLSLGCTRDQAELPEVARRWTRPEQFEAAMRDVASQLATRYSALKVQTPDEDFNRFVNIWLQHQLAYGAYWNRGWGKGFRDGMQDGWGYLLMDPQHVRQMISNALPYQFADGRTVRSFGPVDRKAYNDGGVWLALVVWAYVSETGDTRFMEHRAPFFESKEEGSVLEHIFRAMRYLAESRGSHGMCLMPYGDWNDQLTGPGKGGKGESVWTTLAMAAALPRVAELAELAKQPEMVRKCGQWRKECEEALQRHGWNGQWFTRAFDDEGRPIGHPDNTAGRIDLLPQAWAILADIATPEQRERCLEACRKLLLVEHGYLLMAPAYREFDPSVGQLSATDPGHVENGSNYCHASNFMMNALCRCGRVDDAIDLFHRLLPVNPKNPPARSREEPFSVTNSYYGPDSGPAIAGRSHSSWRTGSAGWMFRTAIEGIMGVQATLEGLHISGRLPTTWDKATLQRRYRGKNVTIQFHRTGKASIVVDGKVQQSNTIAAEKLREGSVVEVTV